MEEFANQRKEAWGSIVQKYHLKPFTLGDIFQGWIADIALNVPFSWSSDMSKSREAGFLVYQNSEKSFIKLFDQLRQEKIIP